MKIKKIILFAAILFFLIVSSVNAYTHVVFYNPDGVICTNGDYYYNTTSIQSAVNFALSGDTIIVCPPPALHGYQAATVNTPSLYIKGFSDLPIVITGFDINANDVTIDDLFISLSAVNDNDITFNNVNSGKAINNKLRVYTEGSYPTPKSLYVNFSTNIIIMNNQFQGQNVGSTDVIFRNSNDCSFKENKVLYDPTYYASLYLYTYNSDRINISNNIAGPDAFGRFELNNSNNAFIYNNINLSFTVKYSNGNIIKNNYDIKRSSAYPIIYLLNGFNHVISGNSIIDFSNQNGIGVSGKNITVYNNTIKNGGGYGIGIASPNYKIYVSDNIIVNVPAGIRANNPNNSVITKNVIVNSTAYGIYFEGNPITNNTIINNKINQSNYGIYLASSYIYNYKNLIYNNYLNNSINAYDAGNNFWNTTKTLGTNIYGGPYLGGNYWNDYTGIDTDGDGLGNTLIPYNSGGRISIGGDYLPLTVVGIVTTTTTTTTTTTSTTTTTTTELTTTTTTSTTTTQPTTTTTQITTTTISTTTTTLNCIPHLSACTPGGKPCCKGSCNNGYCKVGGGCGSPGCYIK